MADKVQWITVTRLPRSDWPWRVIHTITHGSYVGEYQILAEKDAMPVPIGIIRYCCELQDFE